MRLTNGVPVPVQELAADFIREASTKFVAIDEEIGQLAIDAFARFGKGRHRAALNMGDCFSYACAKFTGAKLLCMGDDFIHRHCARMRSLRRAVAGEDLRGAAQAGAKGIVEIHVLDLPAMRDAARCELPFAGPAERAGVPDQAAGKRDITAR